MKTKMIRISEDAYLFLNKLKINRIKTNMENKILTHIEVMDLIVQYFKNNEEESYQNLIKCRRVNNVRD